MKEKTSMGLKIPGKLVFAPKVFVGKVTFDESQ